MANTSDKPIAPHAYFQFLRDDNPPSEEAAQTSAFAGVTTFTGPGGLHRGTKFEKVDFSDIEKGKRRTPRRRRTAGSAMIQHYFVSAWLPKDGVEREYFTSKVATTSTPPA